MTHATARRSSLQGKTPRLLRLSLALLLAMPLPGHVALAAPTAAAPPAASTQDAHAQLAQQIAKVEDTMQLEQLARGLAQAGKHRAAAMVFARLVELRPHLGEYRLQLAAAYAQQDLKSEAYTALLHLQGQGYGYDLADDPRFAKVATTEVWSYILKGFEANAQPFGEGSLAMTLPAEDLLVESIAWDPGRSKLLAGSARKGAVFVVSADGKLEPLVRADASNGMWAVMDVAVDAGRGLLWVASTAIPHFEGYQPERHLGRAGIFKFDLKTGKYLDRYLSPVVAGQSFFMSSIAVGPKGEVYAADGVNNAVYVVRGDEFKRLFHAPRLSGLRGMAVDAAGRHLYFADFERGIMGYDLSSGKPFDLRVPANLALGGAEGLAWWKDGLLVVQNGMEPNRVMRLKLSDDGRSVASVAPLEANKAPLTAPTDATTSGDALFVLANSQKANYDRFGLLKDREALEGTRIWKLDPDFGGQVSPQSIMQPVPGKR